MVNCRDSIGRTQVNQNQASVTIHLIVAQPSSSTGLCRGDAIRFNRYPSLKQSHLEDSGSSHCVFPLVCA